MCGYFCLYRTEDCKESRQFSILFYELAELVKGMYVGQTLPIELGKGVQVLHT